MRFRLSTSYWSPKILFFQYTNMLALRARIDRGGRIPIRAPVPQGFRFDEPVVLSATPPIISSKDEGIS